MEYAIEPIFVAVVRLRTSQKGDQPPTRHSKRPYLLSLTPDQLQLFTTKDASLEDWDELSKHESYRPSEIIKEKKRFLPILGSKSRAKLAASVAENEKQQQEQAKRQSTQDPDELQDDQLFKLGVSLNQIMGVDVDGDKLTVSFQPNRPSKTSVFQEQTLGLLRGMLGGYGSSAKRAVDDPQAHHFTIQFVTPEEATDLKREVYKAQEKLSQAVYWLSEGLPFIHESTIIMFTVTTTTTPSKSKTKTTTPSNTTPTKHHHKAHMTAVTSPALCIPFPAWGTALELPEVVSDALAPPVRGKRVPPVCLQVYLSTPLGPAVAEIPVTLLHRSAEEGNSPLTVTAQLTLGEQAHDRAQHGGNGMMSRKKSVLVHFRAIKGQALPPLAETGPSLDTSSSGVLPTSQEEQQPSTPTRGGGGGGSPSKAAAERTSPSRRQLGDNEEQGGVVLFAIGLASGVVRHIRKGITSTIGGVLSPTDADANSNNSSGERYQWTLILLQAEAVEDRPQIESLPVVPRTLSLSGVADSSSLRPLLASNAPLPACIDILVRQNSDVLTADVAHRFLVGTGSESKAYTALLNLVSYTRNENLVDILRRPQPAFAIVKKYYIHGTLGWTKKKDCLVELECTGAWPEAYEKIRAEGVTDQQMLEHLLFLQKYQFTFVDNRAWPQGKSVKIVDLDGLQMSCLRSNAFTLITKVGALLAAQSPQRMAVCFFVNAPSWWSLAWNLISPMVPAKVRKHMKMFAKSQADAAKQAMLEWIDEELLPVRYGGLNEVPVEESEAEKKLAAYVASLGRLEPAASLASYDTALEQSFPTDIEVDSSER